jgi:glycosyltransferase involved in cell wall biosynthesis
MEVQKDHATLLRAAAIVPDMQVVLVGDGPLRPQLEQLAGDLGIAGRVVFLGHREDVAEVLKACDIYVHSTNAEGFGIAACEAMAAGLPVIASNVPGLADVVAGAAILFPRGDHETLAAELRMLVASPERRLQMSDAGLVRAQCFSIEKTVDDYMEMYRSALSAS